MTSHRPWHSVITSVQNGGVEKGEDVVLLLKKKIVS